MGHRGILRIGVVCLGLCSWSSTRPARADRPAPLSAQTLKAPSGPTSLKGLGESFSANPGTGAGSYEIPIAVPPGFLAPRVSLNYTLGAGKSEVGVGFSLPVLQIYRLTDKGAPKFEETDRFAVSGPEYNDELVEVDATQRLYRLKNEGAFILFRRDAPNDRWLVLHPSGMQSALGETQASRGQALGKTARWYVETTTDAHGHRMRYRYSKDRGKVYWAGVDYQQEAAVAYRNRVEFTYESRPDLIRDFRYGDAEETGSRLKTIEVFQGVRLLRRYTLGYAADTLWSVLARVEQVGENGLAMPPLTFAYLDPSRRSGRFVRMEGFSSLTGIDTGRLTIEDVNADGLPDLLNGTASSYSYTENVDGARFSSTPVSLGVSGSPDRHLDAAGVVMADVDGDGYRDVWYPTGDGRFRWFPGGRIDRGRFLGFGAAQSMNGNGIVSDVTAPAIRLTDLNGDGRTDLLFQRPSLGDVWVENRLGRELVQHSVPALPTGVRLDNGAFELLDFNGDGTLDLVQKEFDGGKHNLRIWYGFGSGKYKSPAQVWGAPVAAPKEVFLTDVNRDGQTDLVRVSGSWVAYHLNDGRGSFGARHGDFRGMPETSRTKKVLLADMNGNGTNDVVWFTIDGGMSYLDLMGEPNVGLLSRIDNGMGLVTDIGYRSSTDYAIEAKLRGAAWKTPMPHPVPVVSELSTRDSLEVLDVEGWESRTTYDYADGFYDGKEREFRGFARVTSTEWGDEFQEGRVTELSMHVGRNLQTGLDEEALKGKVWMEVVRAQNGDLLSSDEVRWEQRWLCQEDLLAEQTQLLPRCAGIPDKNARKDELVAFAAPIGALEGAWERQTSARYTARKSEYDAWGNVIRVEDYGEVTLAGGHALGQSWSFADLAVGVGADERIEETVYTQRIDVAAGLYLTRFVTEEREKSLSGALVSHTRSYYDGAALIGLPLGQIDRGLLTRREGWLAQEARWIPSERKGYNADGLPVQSVDATGSSTSFDYDPETRFYPIAERFSLPNAREAVFRAGYDRGHGAITTLTDANQRITQFRYDGLGRLTRVIDPLSSEQEPTVTYEYSYGTPEHPISATTVRQLVDRGKGVYRVGVRYSDGMGRPRLSKTLSERGYVGSGWEAFSPGGEVKRAAQAFFSSHAGFEAAPASTPATITHRDAMGRPLEEHLPLTVEQGPSFRVHRYFPFETWDYDERDSTEQTFAFPTITRSDGLGRVREVERINVRGTAPVELRWKVGYDVRGEVTSFTDPKNFHRRYTYDSLGRLSTLQDPNLGTITYRYDDAGRITRRSDALGQVQGYAYDVAGRLKKKSAQRLNAQNVLGLESEYGYHYDEPAPGSPLSAPTHLVGRLSRVEFPTGAEHFSYDALGRIERHGVALWDGRSPFAVQERTSSVRSVSHNAADDEVLRQLPGGFSLATTYNARGLIDRMTATLDQSRDIVSGAIYDEMEQLTEVRQGNGLRSCQRYNARGQPIGALLGNAAQVSCDTERFEQANLGLHHVRYTWSYDGMLGAIADRSAPRADVGRLDASYGYDRIRQLVTASTAQGQFGYEYDDIQNVSKRTKRVGTAPAVEESLAYGQNAGPNALTGVGATTLEYDSVGQLERYNGYELTFDVEGRLSTANRPGVRRIDYHYDAVGDRKLLISTDADGSSRVYRYPFPDYEDRNGDAVYRARAAGVDVEIRSSAGLEVDALLLDELTAYVNAPQGKPKPLPDEWLDLNGDGRGFDAGDLSEAQSAYWQGRSAGSARFEWRYVQRDYMGSSIGLTDRAGDLVSTRRYDPYGALARRTGTQPTHGYADAEIEPDEDLGLIRMGARYYAPALQRWVTPDRFIGESPERMANHPLESGLFSYASNNPIVLVDPDGEMPQAVLGALLGFAIELAVQAYTGEYSGTKLAIATGAGALSGGLSAFIGGSVRTVGGRIVANVVANAATGALQESANQAYTGQPQDDKAILRATAIGAVGGLVGSVGGEIADATLGAAAAAKSLNSLKPGTRNLLDGVARTTRSATRKKVQPTVTTVSDVVGNSSDKLLGAADTVNQKKQTASGPIPTSTPVQESRPRGRTTRKQREGMRQFYRLYGPKPGDSAPPAQGG